jgi:UDP-N-acetylenolpyruvoylglucosamine reductase
VGTTPVQNIGAYGAEIKDTLLIVKQWTLKTKKLKKRSLRMNVPVIEKVSIFKQWKINSNYIRSFLNSPRKP